jgi:hypothetical protein
LRVSRHARTHAATEFEAAPARGLARARGFVRSFRLGGGALDPEELLFASELLTAQLAWDAKRPNAVPKGPFYALNMGTGAAQAHCDRALERESAKLGATGLTPF